MDFETWLYIFFILISIIVPIIRNANKGKGKSEAPPPETPIEDIFQTLRDKLLEPQQQPQFEEVEDEFLEEKLEPEYLPVSIDDDEVTESYLKAAQEAENKGTFSYDDELEEDEITEVEHVTVEEEKSTSIQDEYNRNIGETEFSFEFEPVIAVIYSEILKRPEY